MSGLAAGGGAVARLGGVEDRPTCAVPPELVGVALDGNWRGQTQKWFACRFLGDEAEICIDPPDHEQDFARWQWMDLA